MSIKLIVGLGNPGPEYDKTRHNAGAWFVETLASHCHEVFRTEKKFLGQSADINLSNHRCQLLIPSTFMNHSGQSVSATLNFYKLKPTDILVAHDELDLPPGVARFKTGGGHGGHNGLRDIVSHLGTQQFHRLRVGIGHPGHREMVLNYVLGRPSRSDEQKINDAIELALLALPKALSGDMQGAMNQLHIN